jgi:hypothetical protein
MKNFTVNYNIKKYQEYEMKITKMAGYLTDYYLDRAIESDDYSIIAGFLIDYFSGIAGKPFDVGYLVSKYKEYGLDEKIEDIYFDVNEWYKVKYEVDRPREISSDPEYDKIRKMTDDEYIEYMIDKRR